MQKLSQHDSTKGHVLQYADPIMETLLRVFSNRASTVHEVRHACTLYVYCMHTYYVCMYLQCASFRDALAMPWLSMPLVSVRVAEVPILACVRLCMAARCCCSAIVLTPVAVQASRPNIRPGTAGCEAPANAGCDSHLMLFGSFVLQEAMLAVGAFSYSAGRQFTKYLPAFYPFLKMGLANYQEWQVRHACDSRQLLWPSLHQTQHNTALAATAASIQACVALQCCCPYSQRIITVAKDCQWHSAMQRYQSDSLTTTTLCLCWS